MRKIDYFWMFLACFFHSTAGLIVGYVTDFVLPEKLDVYIALVFALIGIASCLFFNFYKLQRFLHILLRILILTVSNLLFMDLFRCMELAQVLGTVIPLRNLVGENYAAAILLGLYAFGIACSFLLGLLIFLFIKLYNKFKKQKMTDLFNLYN